MKYFMSFFFIFCSVCQAQELPVRVEERAINNTDDLEEEMDEEWRIQMQDFLRQPLNLNEASAQDLRTLLILNELQVQSFISYRQTLGKLVSIYELQAVPGWNEILIQKLLPFIRVGPTESRLQSLKTFYKNSEQLFSLRWVKKEINIKNVSGSSDAILGRYRMQFGNQFYAGVLFEKDGGEPWLQSYLPDFTSFHFYMKGEGFLKLISLGDYRVQVGQGLLTSSRTFKTDVISIREGGEVLLPYRSAGETDFFRGVAASLSVGSIVLIPIVSFRKQSVTKDGEGFSSFRRTGLHRTSSEINSRNNLDHLSLGLLARWSKGGWELGLNFISQKFGLPKIRGTEPYQAFDPEGRNFRHFSIEWGKALSRVYFFGELASSWSLKPALVAGIMTSLHPKADFALRFETISQGFQNPFISKKGGSSNIYFAILYRIKKSWQLSLSADQSLHSWPRAQKPAPHSEGTFIIRTDISPDKQTAITLRVFLQKSLRQFDLQGMAAGLPIHKQSLRAQFTRDLNSGITLSGRIESSKAENGTGIMSSLEGRIKIWNYSFLVEGSLFNTDGFDSRFYQTSPAFLNGSSGNVPLYGDGSQIVILIRRMVKKGIMLESRACFRSMGSPEVGFQAILNWKGKQ